MSDTTTNSAAAGRPIGKAAEPPAEITRKTFWEVYEPTVLGAGTILFVLLAWEAVPHVFDLSAGTKLFFAPPSEVASVLYSMFVEGEVFENYTVWEHLAFSAKCFFLGLALSIAVGLPLGVIMGRSDKVSALFDPFITAFNACPRLVFLPLVMLWLGIGLWSVVVIVFIGALFPLLINTYEGVRNADQKLIAVVRSFGANEWEVNKLVVLPNSMPYIVAGLRLAIGRAILGVVVSEFFGGSDAGIGVMMVRAATNYQIGVVFAGLIIFMALSLVMTTGVKVMEDRLTLWRPQEVKTF